MFAKDTLDSYIYKLISSKFAVLSHVIDGDFGKTGGYMNQVHEGKDMADSDEFDITRDEDIDVLVKEALEKGVYGDIEDTNLIKELIINDRIVLNSRKKDSMKNAEFTKQKKKKNKYLTDHFCKAEKGKQVSNDSKISVKIPEIAKKPFKPWISKESKRILEEPSKTPTLTENQPEKSTYVTQNSHFSNNSNLSKRKKFGLRKFFKAKTKREEKEEIEKRESDPMAKRDWEDMERSSGKRTSRPVKRVFRRKR